MDPEEAARRGRPRARALSDNGPRHSHQVLAGPNDALLERRMLHTSLLLVGIAAALFMPEGAWLSFSGRQENQRLFFFGKRKREAFLFAKKRKLFFFEEEKESFFFGRAREGKPVLFKGEEKRFSSWREGRKHFLFR